MPLACGVVSEFSRRVYDCTRSRAAPGWCLSFECSVSCFQFLHHHHGGRARFVRACIFVQCKNELQHLRHGSDDTLASLELAAKIFRPDLGHALGGFFGHLEEDPEQAPIADVGNMTRANVLPGLREAKVCACEFFQLLEMCIACEVAHLGEKE